VVAKGGFFCNDVLRVEGGSYDLSCGANEIYIRYIIRNLSISYEDEFPNMEMMLWRKLSDMTGVGL